MRKFAVALFLSALVFGPVSQAFAAWGQVIDAQTGAFPQITISVFNDSGATLQSGEIVQWDVADTDLAGSFRPYVTSTSTADDVDSAGVLLQTCADQTTCEIVVYGPALVRCADAADAITISTAVGVNGAGIRGLAGDYTPAANAKSIGVALASGDGADYVYMPVFVNTLGGSDP